MFIDVIKDTQGGECYIFVGYNNGPRCIDLSNYKDTVAKYRPYIELCESLEEWGRLASTIYSEIEHLEELKKDFIDFIDAPY